MKKVEEMTINEIIKDLNNFRNKEEKIEKRNIP